MRVGLLTSLLGFTALAAPSPSLEWDAPACAPRPESLPELHAEVLIRERGSDDWLVTVLFVEPIGLRRVSARSCEEARRAALLLLRLGPKAEPTTAPPLEPAPETPPPERPRESAPVVERPPWTISIGLGGALDLGTLASVDPRIALSAMVGREWLALAIDARIGLQQPVASVRVQRAVELQLAACGRFSTSRVAGGPCLSISGGTWAARTPSGREGIAPMGAVSLQLRGAALIVSGLELALLAGVRLNVLRPQPFNADGVIFTTPMWAGDLQATVGWRW